MRSTDFSFQVEYTGKVSGYWTKSTLQLNTRRMKIQRTSEVETHLSSLWSRRERWRGLASFCDSSGHASCKRGEGIREGESEENYEPQTSIWSHSMSSPLTTGMSCMWSAYSISILQWNIDRAMIFKGIVNIRMPLSAYTHHWSISLNRQE